MIEDLDYTEQQAFVQNGILPSDYEKEDYFRLMEVLGARSRDDRPQDPGVALRQLGIGYDKTGGKEE